MIDIMLNASCSSTASSSFDHSPRFTTNKQWRLEDGKSSELDKSDDSIGIDAVIENPEQCVLWYFTYFLGKKHSNYLGTAETIDKTTGMGTGTIEVFGASILKEHHNSSGHHHHGHHENSHHVSYKIIVFTTTGIERQMFHARSKHTSLSASELIRRTAPHLIIKKVREVESPGLLQDFKQLESTQTELSYKFGVLLAKPGQNNEDQFYDNCHGSERYYEFLNNLGETIPLNGFKGFRGGLDVVNNSTGKESIFTTWNDYQIMFHVSTMLPYMDVYTLPPKPQPEQPTQPQPQQPTTVQQQPQQRPKYLSITSSLSSLSLSSSSLLSASSTVSTPTSTSTSPSPSTSSSPTGCQLDRKRHLGNDIVVIIFYDAETDDDLISWDPSSVNSKFNHIFAMVKPQGEGYKVEFIIKNTIATFGPKVPNPSYFEKGDSFKNFLLAKLINGQRSALQSASFSTIIQRTFKGQLQNIYDKYNQSSIIPRRRSASGNNVMVGKELKEKEYGKNPLSSTLKNMLSRPSIFETEALSGNIQDTIRCLDIIESEDSICILVFATHEAIFIFKSNAHSQEPPGYQKVISLKDVSKITYMKQLNILIALTPKGIHVYDMVVVMSYYRHRVDQRLPDRNSDEPTGKRLVETKGCSGSYAYTKNDDDNGITLLYVAVRKTIHQYEWCRNQFIKNKELTMSISNDQTIKTMCSIGPGMLCVGVSSQFLLVDMFTGMIKDLYRKVDSEPIQALCMNSQEVLLCFNNIGFFVNERGHRTRNYEMKWGSIPSSLLLLPNYIVGISGALIEIRTLINGNIIQSIPTSSLSTLPSQPLNGSGGITNIYDTMPRGGSLNNIGGSLTTNLFFPPSSSLNGNGNGNGLDTNGSNSSNSTPNSPSPTLQGNITSNNTPATTGTTKDTPVLTGGFSFTSTSTSSSSLNTNTMTTTTATVSNTPSSSSPITTTSTSTTTISSSGTTASIPPPALPPLVHNAFNTFNGMAYSDNSGSIYVASSSKGSCIIKLKASQSSGLILSPPSSPSVQYLKDTKGILSISTIDRL